MEFFAQMRLILKKGEGRQGLPGPEVWTGHGAAAQRGASCQAPLQPPPSPEHSPQSWPGGHMELQRPPPCAPHMTTCGAAQQPPQSPCTQAVA